MFKFLAQSCRTLSFTWRYAKGENLRNWQAVILCCEVLFKGVITGRYSVVLSGWWLPQAKAQ